MANKELLRVIEEFRQEVRREMLLSRETIERELRKELRDMKTSLEFFNKQFESLKSELEKTLKENVELKVSNESLKQECLGLRRHVNESEARITLCEQYSRNRNLEIKGVASTPNENLVQILGRVGDRLGEPIEAGDIEVVHRVQAKGSSDSNVIVQFLRRSKRNAVLDKARKKRLSAADLGAGSSGPVYVNEHLCPVLKKLMGMTVQKKREKGWRFVWTNNGKIFARKNELSPVLHVSTEADIAKIC